MSNEWRDLPTVADVAAAQAAGDEIEFRSDVVGAGVWYEWNGLYWDKDTKYRARPRPKTKKVKSLCWRDKHGHLFWADETNGFVGKDIWQRFPAGDIEGEAEE